MTPTEVMMLASSPVIAGIGAAAYKGVQAWRAHREKMEARRLELDELRAKNTHEEKLREIAADEVTGKHELEGYREISRSVASAVAMAMVEADRLRLASIEAETVRLHAETVRLRSRDEECQKKLGAAIARLALVEQVPAVRRSLSDPHGTPVVQEIVEKKGKDR